MKNSGWLLTGIFALLFIVLLSISQGVLTPFIAGLILAYVLSPTVEYMVRLGFPRSLASALPVALVIVVLGVASALVVPLLAEQLAAFVQKLPAYMNQLQQALISPRMARLLQIKMFNKDIFIGLLGTMGTDSASWLAANLARLYSGAVAAFNISMLVIMTPLVAFYLVHDWPELQPRLLRALPARWRATTTRMVETIDERLSAYLRGQLTVCVALGLFYGTALELAGLELGWALGMLTGLLAFIPVIGAMVGVLSVFAMALVQYQLGAWEPYAILAAIYVVGQMLEGSVLVPVLVGNRVGLHPVWVIFALLVGWEAMGVMGTLMAIPAAVVISVVLPYLLAAWHKSVT